MLRFLRDLLFGKPNTATPANPNIVNRDGNQVAAARNRRLQLGNLNGGNLATRLLVGDGEKAKQTKRFRLI